MGHFISAAYRTVNAILRRFDLKLSRTDTPTRTFADFFFHVKRLNLKFNTIIDVGIARGTDSIYDSFPDARYYLVEPLEECRPVLEQLKTRLNADYFIVAAGAENSTAQFNVHPDLSGSSFLAQKEGPILDGIKRTVEVRRLDSLLPRKLEAPVLLKIDTQGFELQVVEGLGEILSSIDMLIIECSMMQFREDTPELADVIRFMADRDYVAYDILEGHVRQLDRALAQIDIAFVRKQSPLRAKASFFNDQQAQEYSARWARG